MAEDETVATGTFNGKNGTYSEGWSTTGTGTNTNNCVIIGNGENITSPSLDLSKYTKVTISIKARRFGSLSDSKATIDASINGTSVGTTDATGTNATASLTDIVFTPTTTMTAVNIVFTCTNATSAGSTHGAGINTITITGTKASAEDTRTTTALIFDGEYQTTGDVGGSMGLPTALVKTVVDGVQTGTLNEPTITWTSSNTAVATIDGTTINFVGAGKSTITASFAGDETQYKPSSNSFELTVASIADPVISPSTGTFNETQNITISCATSGATIYYTTDGSDPSASNGTVYTTPIEVSETTTIKAIAVKGEYSSAITESIIRISKPFTLPWSEDWSGYAANDVPSGHSSYYAETDGGTNTKIYAESLAGGTSPELLISKTNGTFTVTEFDLSSLNGEAATLLLQFNANGVLTLSTTTEGVTIGTATNVGNVYSCRIAIPAGTTKLDLTFKNATSKNIRVDNFSLAVSNAPKAPTFDPAPGTYYTGQDVAISCETEGADIYKSTDGENFSKYTSSFPVMSSTTVYAYAEKDGEKSETVSATYIIGSSYDGFAAMQEEVAAEGFTDKAIRYRATGGMTVTFVNGKNAYLLDGSGNGMLAFNNNGWGTSLTAGQKMNYADGYLTATLTKYNGNAELKDITFPEMTGGTVTVTPVEKTLPMTSANQSQLVTLKGLTYNSSDQTLSDGTNSIKYYNNFKINPAPTLENGKQYDVTGIVVMYNENIEICPRTADDVSEVAITVEKPVVNGNPETAAISFLGSVEVALTSDTEGAAIYYTLDGTDPTSESTLYSEPITINGSCTLKAVAILNGVSSEITTIELEQNPLYILGVEDKNNDNNTWSLPADLTPMTWDAENQVYTYSLKNTTTAYFCIANGGTGLADDAWETFNSTYRYSLGEDNINGILNEELQLIKTTAPNSCIVLEPGEYVISVTKEYNKITITGEATIIPPTEDTYVVAGTPEAVFGTEWAGSAEGNKLTKDEETGLYTKTFENVEIAANTTIGYKIVKNGSTWIPDGTGNEHTFTIEEAGTYNITVTFNATSLDYDMTATKVGGDEPTYPITATWDFTQNANPRAEAFFNGTSGTLASNVDGIELSIDATNGKFDSKENRTGDAQANEGTIIKVPVGSTKDQITIVGNWKVNYKIGAAETAITDEPLNYTYTATAADVKEGFVTITSTSNNNYFYSITLVKNEPEEIVDPSLIYSWESPEGTVKEIGGTAKSFDGTTETTEDEVKTCINFPDTYHVLRLNGKNDFSTSVVTIELNNALNSGDIISITGYRRKDAADKKTGALIKFEKGTTQVRTDTSDKQGLEFVNIDTSDASAADQNRGTEPNTIQLTVPETADGSKTLTLTRAQTGTNLWITKLTITRPETDPDAVATPVISPKTGTYTSAQEVTITCATDDAAIYYTTDGTDPTATTGTAYTEAFTVSETTTVKAIAVKGDNASDIAEAVITITEVQPGTSNLKWDYMETAPANNPDEGLYYGSKVDDAAGTNNGMKGVKLNGSGYAFFAKNPVAGKLTLNFGNRKTNEAFAVNVYACTIADGVATKGDLIGKVSVAESPGKGSIEIPATVTGIYIERETSAEGVLQKIVFKETVARAFEGFEITNEEMKTEGYNGSKLPTGVTFSGSHRGDDHGYGNVTLTVPTDGGAVKFTIGGCQYANPATFTVKNAAGETLATLDQKTNTCYHQDKAAITYFYTGDATTLTFGPMAFLPYFKAEPVDVEEVIVTYKDQNGNKLGSKTLYEGEAIGEIPYTETDLNIAEGYAFRGWVYASGIKVKPTDIVTGNVTVKASVTAIEEDPTVGSIQVYDLTKATFYPEDHENCDATNGKYYNNHGWDFAGGGSFSVKVAGKAQVVLSLCEYGSGTTITVTDANNGTVAENVPAKAESGKDGATTIVNYEGEATTLTFTFASQTYLHSVKVFNVKEFVEKDETSGYYMVPAGDAVALVLAINSANAETGAKIFLANGEYNLGKTTLTTISGNNMSIIGESMDGVIIKNSPEAEGIGVTATLLNTSTGLYMQDLTLKNEWDYYGIAGDGRAVCLQDKGTNTICKNVKLLSYQDTYYTNNKNGEYYWETSDIHGTVDFICGEGTLFMESSILTVEKRTADGSGECTITAPSTVEDKKYGYVFNNCTIDNKAEKYNYGRAWNNEPRCAYLNTTVNDDKLVADRWTLKGMNQYPAKAFYEYNTKNANGTVVSPSSFIKTFTASKGEATNPDFETILSADQAAAFTVENIFGTWAPDAKAKQATVPTNVTLNSTTNTLSWDASEDALLYAVCKDGSVVDFTTEASYTIPAEQGAKNFGSSNTTTAEQVNWTVRSANAKGGLSPQSDMATVVTGIVNVETKSDANDDAIYNMQGVRVSKAQKGVYIINGRKVVVK